MTLDRAWVDAVVVHLQPVFDAAETGPGLRPATESSESMGAADR